MRLLLVEDDVNLTTVLAGALRKERAYVDCVSDGVSAVTRAMREPYDLMLLDLTLPGCDGLDACRQLRTSRIDVPILVITGRGAVEERVRALDNGADDYLIKPFELPELLARVRALTRRGRTKQLQATLEYGPLSLDPRDQTIRLDGARLDLSATEYRLLAHLMKRAEAIVTRDELIREVWGGAVDQRSNTVDVYVSYLRQILGRPHSQLIHTVRGLGYVLREERVT